MTKNILSRSASPIRRVFYCNRDILNLSIKLNCKAQLYDKYICSSSPLYWQFFYTLPSYFLYFESAERVESDHINVKEGWMNRYTGWEIRKW